MRKEEIKKPNKKTKGKHKKKILRVLVYIVLVMFVLSLLFLIGYGVYHFSTSSNYIIKNVKFKSSTRYDEETLKTTANIPIGENLYKVSKRYIAKNLETLPYIKDVKIKRQHPDTILVTVSEYTPTYLAYNHETEKYVRLTNAGLILEEIPGEQKTEQELLVFGIAFDDNFKLKTSIANTEIEKLNQYEIVKKVYEKTNIEKEITNVEFKDETVILTLDYDTNVIVNNNDLEYNMEFLKEILKNISGKAGTIDMTKPNPVFTESIR